jgi:hypothetical protein
MTPADVYVLLKSSDFVTHDLSAESVFEGCVDNGVVDDGGGGARGGREYKLELVLRKWFAIDPSREMRAFVRDGVLVGASPVSSTHFLHFDVRLTPTLSPPIRHLATRYKLLRVSERA